VLDRTTNGQSLKSVGRRWIYVPTVEAGTELENFIDGKLAEAR
jgi:hypothetical protein